MPDDVRTPWIQAYLAKKLPGEIGTLCELWIAEMLTDGKSGWTLAQYKREVERLIDQVGEKPIAEVTRIDVQTFKMERGRDRAPATVRRALICLRQFFAWAEDNEAVTKNPTKRIGLPPIPESEPTFWTPDEVRRILAAPGVGPRDKLLLYVLAHGGQRLTPTRTLTWDRVHLDGRQPYIAFPRAKGGKYHQVPVGRTLYQMLKSYQALVQPQPTDYLFVSRQRRKRDAPGSPKHAIGPTQVYRIITEACRAAGVRVATAHEFRKSLTTRLLADPSVPFVAVSKGILNHSNPQTTMKHYAGRDFDQVAAALRDPY